MVKGHPTLGSYYVLHLLTTLSISVLMSRCATLLLLSLFSCRDPQLMCALFPICNTILVPTEGKKVTQMGFFPLVELGRSELGHKAR